MVRRKVPVKLVLPVNQLRRLADVYMLLIEADRRMEVQRSSVRKTKKANAAKQGSLKGGPFLLLYNLCILKVSVAITSILRNVIYDRHHCFNTNTRYVSHQRT